MSSFEIPGFDEFMKRVEAVADKLDAKKMELTGDLAVIAQSEITPLIPSDTDRLRSSFQIGTVTPDYSEVGTNVEYALYVNDGHVQHRRFLPAVYLSANGKRLYLKNREGQRGEPRGIMLRERYIPGRFFLENGMKSAEPRMKDKIESWMEELAREIEGAGL